MDAPRPSLSAHGAASPVPLNHTQEVDEPPAVTIAAPSNQWRATFCLDRPAGALQLLRQRSKPCQRTSISVATLAILTFPERTGTASARAYATPTRRWAISRHRPHEFAARAARFIRRKQNTRHPPSLQTTRMMKGLHPSLDRRTLSLRAEITSLTIRYTCTATSPRDARPPGGGTRTC
jgi:hypothetical protein